jgi:lipopolysaccharide export system permease protein
MKILNAYVARMLATTVLLALGVLTFVMAAGHIFRVFEWLARGGSPAVLGRFLLLRLPDMMRFTLPLAMLVGVVLVFSHMAADNELTAMKACGLSLWQVIAPGVLLSVLLSALCFWFATSVGPRCQFAADQLMWEQAAVSPLVLFEDSGGFIELEGMNIRVDRRDGETLYGIHVLRENREQKLQESITARQGYLRADPGNRSFSLVLQDFTVGRLDTDPAAEPKSGVPDRYAGQEIALPLSGSGDEGVRKLSRKPKYMDLRTLLGRICLDQENGQDTTPLLVELHTRMSMSLSPIAFLLVGIPFAVRSRRSETSVGLLLALLLALGFYVFLLVSRSLKNDMEAHPQVLIWLPNLIYQVGGLWALVLLGRR